MTPAELDEIEARLVASGGPWRRPYPPLDTMTGNLFTATLSGVPVSANLRFDPPSADARIEFLAHVHADMAQLIAELRARIAREDRDRGIGESHRRICVLLDNGNIDGARAATNDLARIVGEDHRDVVGLRTILHFMNLSGEER